MTREELIAELQQAVLETRRAAYGDSNDREIEALQNALELALDLISDFREIDYDPDEDDA